MSPIPRQLVYDVVRRNLSMHSGVHSMRSERLMLFIVEIVTVMLPHNAGCMSGVFLLLAENLSQDICVVSTAVCCTIRRCCL